MIKLISTLLMVLLLSFTNSNKQDKEYSCHLTLNEYNILISNPDDVSANARKAVIQKVVSQIQPQIIADTIKNKK